MFELLKGSLDDLSSQDLVVFGDVDGMFQKRLLIVFRFEVFM
jgi:hypothetical protein